MDKGRFMELAKQRQTGERVRILWEILMELIGAQPEDERTVFWTKLRETFQGEYTAMEELMKRPELEKKSRNKRTKPLVSDDESDSVSLSN